MIERGFRRPQGREDVATRRVGSKIRPNQFQLAIGQARGSERKPAVVVGIMWREFDAKESFRNNGRVGALLRCGWPSDEKAQGNMKTFDLFETIGRAIYLVRVVSC